MEIDELKILKDRRDELKQGVIGWMNAEGAEGRLRTNSQAPMWIDYEASERALAEAVAAL